MMIKRTAGAVAAFAAAALTASCFIPSASAAVVPTLHTSEMASSLTTSFDPYNYITFTVDGDRLSCDCILTRDGLDQIMFRLQDKNGKLIGEKLTFDISSGVQFSAGVNISEINGLPDEFFIEVYTSATADRSDELWNNHSRSVLVAGADGKYAFRMSPVLQSNSEQLDRWINPGDALDKHISEEIKALSDEICLGIGNKYEKARAIYIYVAENIYYDFDYATGKSEHTANTADEVLAVKRAMPSGFCNLLEALLEAQGIPAVVTKGHTTNMTELIDGIEYRYINFAVEALVDGRSVIMLPYRETVGKYENGEYSPWIKRAYRGFDITPEFFATFFKVTERDNAKAPDTPSSWAQTELTQAISAGLVPAELQQDYRGAVTRDELYSLIMSMLCVSNGLTDTDALLEALEVEYIPFFKDTDSKEANAAHLLGIVTGRENGVFASEEKISRKEAAVAIFATAKLLGITATDSTAYTDIETVSPFEAGAITAVSGIYTDSGCAVMGGVTEGVFAPDALLTREQAIIILYRLYLAI